VLAADNGRRRGSTVERWRQVGGAGLAQGCRRDTGEFVRSSLRSFSVVMVPLDENFPYLISARGLGWSAQGGTGIRGGEMVGTGAGRATESHKKKIVLKKDDSGPFRPAHQSALVSTDRTGPI